MSVMADRRAVAIGLAIKLHQGTGDPIWQVWSDAEKIREYIDTGTAPS